MHGHVARIRIIKCVPSYQERRGRRMGRRAGGGVSFRLTSRVECSCTASYDNGRELGLGYAQITRLRVRPISSEYPIRIRSDRRIRSTIGLGWSIPYPNGTTTPPPSLARRGTGMNECMKTAAARQRHVARNRLARRGSRGPVRAVLRF